MGCGHRPGDSSRSRGTRCVNSVAFSPDGRRLASASDDQTVKVWDAATRPGAAHPQGTHGTGMERGLQPGRPAAGLRERRPDGEGLGRGQRPGVLTLKGHTDHVYSVAFSPDGRRLASASWDQTVKLWDAATRPGAPHPQGAHGRCLQRGLQPGRPAAGLGKLRPDGEGVGRGHGPGDCSPSRGTRTGHGAWPSARTAGGWRRRALTRLSPSGTPRRARRHRAWRRHWCRVNPTARNKAHPSESGSCAAHVGELCRKPTALRPSTDPRKPAPP